jgi:hypothetical protein
MFPRLMLLPIDRLKGSKLPIELSLGKVSQLYSFVGMIKSYFTLVTLVISTTQSEAAR